MDQRLSSLLIFSMMIERGANLLWRTPSVFLVPKFPTRELGEGCHRLPPKGGAHLHGSPPISSCSLRHATIVSRLPAMPIRNVTPNS